MNTQLPSLKTSFEQRVLRRDAHRCVLCPSQADTVHCILNPALFRNGLSAYETENGVSLCNVHLLLAQTTQVSVEALREAAGITVLHLPDHMYVEQKVDHWGNPIISGGRRVWGEMFHLEHVQKMLRQGCVLDLFSSRVKYQRTLHVPWSQGATSDDKMLDDMSHFEGREVVVSVKMDGEQSNLYSDAMHAKSLDSDNHPSRNWLKNFWGSIAHEIPLNWRICGENVFAKHSIAYDNLQSFFFGFSMWDHTNTCLSWNETLAYFEMLGIEPVPQLYRGVYDEKLIKALFKDEDRETMEGYVIRLADSFHYRDFSRSIAKFVRKNHVQTDEHWMSGPVVPNKLAR